MIIELKKCAICKKLIRKDKLMKFRFRKGKREMLVCENCFRVFCTVDELIRLRFQEIEKEDQ